MQPLNQLINQRINQPSKQPLNQSINRPTNRPSVRNSLAVECCELVVRIFSGCETGLRSQKSFEAQNNSNKNLHLAPTRQ